MSQASGRRTNITGAGEVGEATPADMDKSAIHKTNSAFWDTNGTEVLGATALPFYGAFVSEEKCRLFGDVAGKKLLEIGCGTGHSLQYLGERQAAELWGMDISEKQIEKARRHLAACGLSATLICSPMEEACGIPPDYFDESWYSVSVGGDVLTLSDRKLSTYVNALAGAGFVIEQMVEQSDEALMQPDNSRFADKARMLPVTFVIKARKL